MHAADFRIRGTFIDFSPVSPGEEKVLRRSRSAPNSRTLTSCDRAEHVEQQAQQLCATVLRSKQFWAPPRRSPHNFGDLSSEFHMRHFVTRSLDVLPSMFTGPSIIDSPEASPTSPKTSSCCGEEIRDGSLLRLTCDSLPTVFDEEAREDELESEVDTVTMSCDSGTLLGADPKVKVLVIGGNSGTTCREAVGMLMQIMESCSRPTAALCLVCLWVSPSEDEDAVDTEVPAGMLFELKELVTTAPQLVVAFAHGQHSGSCCKLLACCDLVVATSTSTFAMPDGGMEAVTTATATARGLVAEVVEGVEELSEVQALLEARAEKCRVEKATHTSRRMPQRWPLQAGTWATGAPQVAVPTSSQASEQASPKAAFLDQAAITELGAAGVVPARPITTWMVCDIPCRLTAQDISTTLKALGFEGFFDFLYVPCRGPNHSRGNVGYFFINLVDQQKAWQFAQTFQGFRFKGTRSTKSCVVKPAQIQGRQANIQHLSSKRSKHFNMSQPQWIIPVK